MRGSTTLMGRWIPLPIAALAAAALLFLLHPPSTSVAISLFPSIEVTLANDGPSPVWFMCQKTEHKNSLHQLPPNETYLFTFDQVAFPMRWCYLYISRSNHGFFWAFTLRSHCTKCFWSINRHPSLYRGDKGRWERQKLFMPSDFNITKYADTKGPDGRDGGGPDDDGPDR